jgi:hypothetical protein
VASGMFVFQVLPVAWVGKKAKASTDRDEILVLDHNPAGALCNPVSCSVGCDNWFP